MTNFCATWLYLPNFLAKRSARRIVIASLLAIAAWPAAVLAHGSQDGDPVLVDLIEARRQASGAVRLDFAIYNISSDAVTLRGLSSPAVTRVTMETIWRFMSWEIPRPIDYVRLDPGELEMITAPDYRVLAWGVEPTVFEFDMELDFGPIGQFIMPISLPD